MYIKDIIETEKKLLYIQDKHKFDLEMNDLIMLNRHIKTVGEITSLYFDTLYEYSKGINNIEKLKTYKEKLDNSYIDDEIDLYSIKRFINAATQKLSGDN